MKQFLTSPSKRVRGISSIVLISLVMGLVGLIYGGFNGSRNQQLLFTGVGLLMIAVGIYTYGTAPIGIEVNNVVLKIQRRWGASIINLADIRSVRRLTNEDMQGFGRIFGNGGLFAWTGLFRSKSLSKFYLYATQLDKLVLLELPDEKVVVSVDDPEVFETAIKNR